MKTHKRVRALATIGAAGALLAQVVLAPWSQAIAGAASTLEQVRERGHVICGISEATPGFATTDKQGALTGLEIDFCAAVSAAIFGRKDAVKYRSLSSAARSSAVAAGEVDLAARHTSWTLSKDTELGLRYAGTLFYDGQGFLVRRGFAVASVLELSGASVCLTTGTPLEKALAAYFGAKQMRYQIVVADRWQDAVAAYADTACTLLTGDVSQLAVERSRLVSPAEHMILPELISKELSGPVVRAGDDQWLSLVRWVLNGLIAAEELGITTGNADEQMAVSRDKDVRRYLGLEGNLGETLGLDASWSYNMVKLVGNYGEIFARNLGLGSPLLLERGPNALWAKGGLLYAIPIR